MNDIRLLFRSWRRSPGFAVTAVVVIATGIGLCTAISSLVLSIAFPSIPFPHPEQLVEVWATSAPQYEDPGDYLVPERAYEWERQPNRALGNPALVASSMLTLRRHDDAERLGAAAVGGEFFGILRVPALRGRWLTAEDDRPGAAPAAVLSYDAWERLFQRDVTALGQVVELSSQSFTIVGIMPRAFAYPRQTEVWVPLRTLPRDRAPVAFLQIARLPAGVTIAAARAEALQRSRAEFKQDSTAFGRQGATVVALGSLARRLSGTRMLLLLSCALVVFLLAIGNIATLMVLRIGRGWRDASIRAALGASRTQLMRPVLLEAGLLSVTGGVIGVLLANWIAQGARVLLGAGLTDVGFAIDARVVVVVLMCVTATSLFIGLVPALRLQPERLQQALRDVASGLTARSSVSRGRLALLAIELALATALGSGAIVLARSYRNLARLELGYETDGVSILELHDDPDSHARPAFESVGETMGRLEHDPAFTAVAAWREVTPQMGRRLADQVSIATSPIPVNRRSQLLRSYDVTPQFFDLLRIRILRGRGIAASDTRPSRPVAVINQLAADVFWPGRDPVGQQIRFGGDASNQPWLTVVGVVGNTALFNHYGRDWYRWRTNWNGPQQNPLVYRAFAQSAAQSPDGWMVLFRRTALAARGQGDVSGLLRAAIYTADPNANVVFTGAMSTWHMEGADYNSGRTEGRLFAAFALLALVVAVIGIYSVVADVVRSRKRELGIRVALGARSTDLFRLVAGITVLHAAFGVLIGSLVMVSASSLLSRSLVRTVQLVGVRWSEPFIVLPTTTLLLMVAGLAAWRGIQAVGKIDPVVALRAE